MLVTLRRCFLARGMLTRWLRGDGYEVLAEATRLGASLSRKPFGREDLRAAMSALGLGDNLPRGAESPTDVQEDDSGDGWLS